MDQKQHSKLVIAIKRHIAENFTLSDWEELSYLTDGSEIIQQHPRLLRSLHFGDEDYEFHILGVVEELIQKNPTNLQTIIEYTDLHNWLKEHMPKEFEDLYGYTYPVLEGIEQKAVTNSFDLSQHINRIRRAIESDPELAVGSTKEMVESVLKSILEAKGETVEKEDLPQLLKRAQKALKLDPSEVDVSANGAEIVKRILSNLGQVFTGISELRNLYGTGHGRTRPSGISPRHARLVVNAGAALAVFFMETFEYHQKSDTQ